MNQEELLKAIGETVSNAVNPLKAQIEDVKKDMEDIKAENSSLKNSQEELKKENDLLKVQLEEERNKNKEQSIAKAKLEELAARNTDAVNPDISSKVNSEEKKEEEKDTVLEAMIKNAAEKRTFKLNKEGKNA
ncbi:hypothetical protein [Brachyspira alvinipulli]|uniref:hypothetical protein n=1 Tax=Brachyspira alvinipulli TaxID=84379 RepID=UPI00047FA290|nr:hypothetical protein [Brachyspira alvinipulli]